MEHTVDSHDDVAIRKDLSYLCILIVLILHILFLLLLFTFTHLIKKEPMTPSFDTAFDVSAPTSGTMPPSTGTGSGIPSSDDDDQTSQSEPADESVGTDQDGGESESAPGEPIESVSPLMPEGTPLPDIVDHVNRSEGSSTESISPRIFIPTPQKTTHTTGRGYRVRKRHYDTNFSINGTTFAQMGQQVHNNISQTRVAEAKEKQTKKFKYQSYINSLHHFLYGNFNPRNESINLEYSVYMPIDVDIEIDKKGLCKTISLSNSTGDRDLDSFIVYHLKKSGPFPPLPDHFGVDSWHFQLRLMVNCQRGKGIPKITPH